MVMIVDDSQKLYFPNPHLVVFCAQCGHKTGAADIIQNNLCSAQRESLSLYLFNCFLKTNKTEVSFFQQHVETLLQADSKCQAE